MASYCCGLCAVCSAAREVNHNLASMVSGGQSLEHNPFWRFVMDNAPNSLHLGYRTSLYGLVSTQAEVGGGGVVRRSLY
jgi:hypothetical protein